MKKSFDAVAWMRKRREEIDREDAGLSWKEKREKRPWQELNLQSPDSKSDALTIRPQGRCKPSVLLLTSSL